MTNLTDTKDFAAYLKAFADVWPYKRIRANQDQLKQIRDKFNVDIKDFAVTVDKDYVVTDDTILEAYANLNKINVEYNQYSELEKAHAKIARLERYLSEIFDAHRIKVGEEDVDRSNPVIARVWNKIEQHCDLIYDVVHAEDVPYMEAQRKKRNG